jgi:hypothetical protein
MPLFFHKRYLPAILQGEKTTTLRRWKSPRVRASGRASVPGIGSLNILSCDPIKLADITEDDARNDGFESRKDLFKTLRKIYPDQKSDGRKWFRVVFSRDDARQGADKNLTHDARTRVVREIRADLDKAVRQT